MAKAQRKAEKTEKKAAKKAKKEEDARLKELRKHPERVRAREEAAKAQAEAEAKQAVRLSATPRWCCADTETVPSALSCELGWRWKAARNSKKPTKRVALWTGGRGGGQAAARAGVAGSTEARGRSSLSWPTLPNS